MDRRVGVVGADHALHLRQHAGGFVLFWVTMDSAPTRSPYSEALEKELDRRTTGRRRRTVDRHGVGFDAVGEALVGHVEEGDQARLAQALTTSAHWASVRSAPVGLWQQACSTITEPAGRVFSFGDHRLGVGAAGGRVVVG